MSTWSFSSVSSLTIRFCVCIALSKGVAVRDLFRCQVQVPQLVKETAPRKGTLEFFQSRMKMMSLMHRKFPNLQATPDSWNSVIFWELWLKQKEEEWKTDFPWERRNLLWCFQEGFREVRSVLRTFWLSD